MKKVKYRGMIKYDSIEDSPFLIEGSRYYYNSLDGNNVYEIYEEEGDFVDADYYYDLLKNNPQSGLYFELPYTYVHLIDDIKDNWKSGYLMNSVVKISLAELVNKSGKSFFIGNVIKIFELLTSCIFYLHTTFDIGHGNLHDQNIKVFCKELNVKDLYNVLVNGSVQNKDVVVKISHLSPTMNELSPSFDPPELLMFNLGLRGNPSSHSEAQGRDIWVLGIIFYELLSGGTHYISGLHVNDEDGSNDLIENLDEMVNWKLLCNNERLLNLNGLNTYDEFVEYRRESLIQKRKKLAIDYMLSNNERNKSYEDLIDRILSFLINNILVPNPANRANIIKIKEFISTIILDE